MERVKPSYCQGCGKANRPNEQYFLIGRVGYRFKVCRSCRDKFEREKVFKNFTFNDDDNRS